MINKLAIEKNKSPSEPAIKIPKLPFGATPHSYIKLVLGF